MIHIKNLNKTFREQPVLKDLSFTIGNGTILGLLGPNGAGKTTLIRILTKLISFDSGNILINDIPLNSIDKNTIGYLPEERGLYRDMKVGDHIIYIAHLRGLSTIEAEERVESLLKKYDIMDWWNLKICNLSKGMQQKIQFIISILHNPNILVLDEPFSGLDPTNTKTISDHVIELNKQGVTIILSTHDMNSVTKLCKEIVLINHGKKIISGKTEDIINEKRKIVYEFEIKSEYTEMNLHISNYGKIVESGKNFNNNLLQIQFFDTSLVNKFLLEALQHGYLVSYREILPSIQDIFIELTGNT